MSVSKQWIAAINIPASIFRNTPNSPSLSCFAVMSLAFCEHLDALSYLSPQLGHRSGFLRTDSQGHVPIPCWPCPHSLSAHFPLCSSWLYLHPQLLCKNKPPLSIYCLQCWARLSSPGHFFTIKKNMQIYTVLLTFLKCSLAQHPDTKQLIKSCSNIPHWETWASLNQILFQFVIDCSSNI